MWATNSAVNVRKVRLILKAFDLRSDWTNEHKEDAELLPNQTTELLSIPCPSPPPQVSDDPAFPTSYSVVVSARLVDSNSGEILARYADWPQPYRLTDYPDPGLRVSVEGEEISVEVEKPVKGLVFTVDDPRVEEDVKWSDNALDVVPGDRQTVLAQGLGGRPLKVAYFGHERATRV